jgi:hypothetical protein
VEGAPQIQITPVKRDYSGESAQFESNKDLILQNLLATLKKEFESDPFAMVRAAVRDPRPLFQAIGS